MRKKTVRFPLKLKDDAEARSLEELRENFELERIIKYFSDGSLEKWLDCWMLTDEAEKVRALDKDDKAIGRKLCEIFGVEPPREAVDTEDIAWRTERENRLKQYTGDKEILEKVDFVAFDTEDLYDILEEEDTDTIYLCNNSFNFNSGVLKHKNKHYIGIGKAEAVIGSKEIVDFEGLGIAFENVKFDEAYKNIPEPSKLTATEEISRFSAVISALPPHYYPRNKNFVFMFGRTETPGRILLYENFYQDAIVFVKLSSSHPISTDSKFILRFGNMELADGKIWGVYDHPIENDFDFIKQECEFIKGKQSSSVPHAIAHFESAARMGSKEAAKDLISIYEQQGNHIKADHWKSMLESMKYRNFFQKIWPKM